MSQNFSIQSQCFYSSVTFESRVHFICHIENGVDMLFGEKKGCKNRRRSGPVFITASVG